jgi:predicted nucleic acid-binding protein
VTDRILIDTSILIDHFRKRPEAMNFIANLSGRPIVSVITVAELFAGVRQGQERREIESFLSRSVLIDVDEQIGIRAGLILRQYRKSHGVGLADALIAASAEADSARVATLNVKHFPMFSDLFVPYQKA